MKKERKRKALLLLAFLTGSICVSAQNASSSSRNSTVQPLSEFLETYKQKHRTISEATQNDTKLNFSEKLALYESKISKLREDFKTTRKSEYLSKTAKRAKRYTCTGTHVRNTTECATVYINSPNSDMYTTKEWVTVEGENKANITVDSSSVSLKMRATGKRSYKGVIYATFKYKPGNISALVDKEAAELFDLMTKE